ncbi:MAG: hypothetical protein MRY63_06220 [Neomegalonema sp.]|nr:hypothetical protein [Neomegalonema sp.]
MRILFALTLSAGMLFAQTVQALEIISHTYIDSSYESSFVDALRRGGPDGGAAVEIIGLPDGQARAQELADRVHIPPYFPRAGFTAIEPGKSAQALPRIVLVFAPATGVDSSAACTANAASAGLSDRVLVAYCHKTDLISSAVLRAASVREPFSGAFEASLRQVMLQVLPRRNPERDRDNGCLFLC